MKKSFTKTIFEYRSNDDILYSLVRVISFDRRFPTHYKLFAQFDNSRTELVYQSFWNWFFVGDLCMRVLNSIMDIDLKVSSRSFTKVTYRGR